MSKMLTSVGAGLVATSMLMMSNVAVARAEVTVPEPLVHYDFDDLVAGTSTITANRGSGGAAFNGNVLNKAGLLVGSREGTPTLRLPGGIKGTTESTMPYVRIPNGIFEGASGITVSTWINWDGEYGGNASASPWAYYLGGDKLYNINKGFFVTPDKGGKLTATVDNPGVNGTSQKDVSQSSSLPADTWQLVTFTDDGTTGTLYVNGSQVASGPAPLNFASAHNAAATWSGLIGRTAFTATYAPFFGGELDDFQIWRSVLTAEQVEKLYDFDATIESLVAPADITIGAGETPSLPSAVQAVYSDGETRGVPVTWAAHDWPNATAGTVTLEGTVEGTSLKASQKVHVVAAVSITNPANVSVPSGKTPTLPTTVDAVYSDGLTRTVPVIWETHDWSTQGVGSVTLQGDVRGTALKASITVQVTANEVVSVEPMYIRAAAGVAPTMPTVVNAVYTSGTTLRTPVTWPSHDWAAQGQGTVNLEGTVEGTSLKAALTVEVVPARSGKVVASKTATNQTKGYLEVDGKPYSFMGIQNMSEWSRYGNDYQFTGTFNSALGGYDTCNGSEMPNNWNTPLFKEAWSENLFEKTAAAGFKTIQFMFSWKNIEPDQKGVYDWHILDQYLDWADKYDLRINFVWFGTNTQGGAIMEDTPMCYGFMAMVPEWAQEKKPDGSWKYFGAPRTAEKYITNMPTSPTDTTSDAAQLFAAEADAVRAMFNHLAEVDDTNRTILFNVWNEPDNGSGFTSINSAGHAIWMKLAADLNKAVKESNYSVATTMNFHRSYWTVESQRAALLDFANAVDFVGPDSYDTNIANQVGYLAHATAAAENGYVGWIPEFGGNAANKTGTVAAILANGGTVSFWELNDALVWKDTTYSFYGISNQGYPRYTTWQLGTIPPMPTSAQKMTNFNKSLNKMQSLVAKSLPINMAEFNSGIETTGKTTPATQYSATKVVGAASVKFTTTNGTVGFAVYNPDDKATYLMTDSLSGALTFNLGPDMVASVGAFDADGTWVATDSRAVDPSGDVSVAPTELVRVLPAALTTVDKAALGALIAQANQDYQDGGQSYTATSWAPFESALQTAQSVYDDPEATQEDVDTAASALESAWEGLTFKNADLQAAVDAVAGLNGNDYTTSSWSAVETALATAQAVLADTDATQQQIDAATSALTTATAGLEFRGDPEVLHAVIATADGLSTKLDAFTDASADALRSALSSAKSVYDNRADKTQAQFEAAVATLQSAVNGLVIKSPTPSKTVLQHVYDTTRVLSNTKGHYTAVSWAKLHAEVTKAKQVLDDPSATQAQIDTAVEELNSALAGLELVEDELPTPPSTPLVAKVKLNQSQLRLVKGKSFTLVDAVYYADATTPASYSGKVTWKSSNTKTATVSSNGAVKAKKTGTVTIAVTSTETNAAGNRLSTSIKITVVKSKPKSKVTKVTAAVPKAMNVGQVAYVTGKYSSSKATGVKVTYASSKPGVASIDKAGRILAVSKGTASIKVKAGGKTKTYTVTVK